MDQSGAQQSGKPFHSRFFSYYRQSRPAAVETVLTIFNSPMFYVNIYADTGSQTHTRYTT